MKKEEAKTESGIARRVLFLYRPCSLWLVSSLAYDKPSHSGYLVIPSSRSDWL